MSGYSDGGASLLRQALKSWHPRHLSAKSDIDFNLNTLRNRAHDLAINSPLGAAIINTLTQGVIGSGLKLFPRVDANILSWSSDKARAWNKLVKREFNIWASEPLHCDFLKRNNFYELQAILFRAMLTDGDSFCLFKRRVPTDFNPYSLRLHAIEGLRISNPAQAGNTIEAIYKNNRIINGIELNRDGAIQAVWIANRLWNEPALNQQLEWKRVRFFGSQTGCKNVVQIAKDIRPDQCRGIPILAPIIETLKQISRFAEAELGAAIVRSFFSIFFTQSERDQSLNDITGRQDELDVHDFKLDSPSVTSLPRGVDVKAIENSKSQSSFEVFMSTFIKQAGAAVNLPYEVLLKNFQSSYSASRAALLQAEQEFRARKAAFITDFCLPVYELFLTEAIALGRIDAPEFDDPLKRTAYLSADWFGESTKSLDPVKETQASILKLSNGLSTYRKELSESNGLDFDDVIEILKQERTLLQ